MNLKQICQRYYMYYWQQIPLITITSRIHGRNNFFVLTHYVPVNNDKTNAIQCLPWIEFMYMVLKDMGGNELMLEY